MKAETIIAIVTAGIAFLTSVASFTYNLIQNKKTRIQKVVLDNRINYLKEIREGFTSIIGLSDLGAITLAKSTSDVMKIYVEKLFCGYGKIKTFIKPFYAIDKELLLALDELYNAILSALNGNADCLDRIDSLRNDFADKYLLYDWAYWKYIQRQKDGNFIDSDGAFDEVYNDFSEQVKKGSI